MFTSSALYGRHVPPGRLGPVPLVDLEGRCILSNTMSRVVEALAQRMIGGTGVTIASRQTSLSCIAPSQQHSPIDIGMFRCRTRSSVQSVNTKSYVNQLNGRTSPYDSLRQKQYNCRSSVSAGSSPSSCSSPVPSLCGGREVPPRRDIRGGDALGLKLLESREGRGGGGIRDRTTGLSIIVPPIAVVPIRRPRDVN